MDQLLEIHMLFRLLIIGCLLSFLFTHLLPILVGAAVVFLLFCWMTDSCPLYELGYLVGKLLS
jgi:hypothetical protein